MEHERLLEVSNRETKASDVGVLRFLLSDQDKKDRDRDRDRDRAARPTKSVFESDLLIQKGQGSVIEKLRDGVSTEVKVQSNVNSVSCQRGVSEVVAPCSGMAEHI